MRGSCQDTIPDALGIAQLSRWAQQRSFRVKHSPSPQTQVAVIVPVRNEAQSLTATLGALALQVDFVGHAIDPRDYEIIVLANNCTDDSAAIARQFARQHPHLQLHVETITLPPPEAHIGRVRQLLMDEAHRRLSVVNSHRAPGIIASTDGDSQVDCQWIAALRYEVEQGADAVGGRTVTQRAERAALDRRTRATYLRFVGYRYLVKQLEDCLDPDSFDRAPRHYQFFGANFAVTCAMYARAGGLPPLPTGEDVAFRDALLRVGAKVRHSLLMRVTTSARQQGRAKQGLADRLSQFQTLGQQQRPFEVPAAAAVEAQILARRDLRRYWQQHTRGQSALLAVPMLVTLAAQLAVPLADLQRAIDQATCWGDLVQRVEVAQQATDLGQQGNLVPIEQAIADLRLRLHSLRQRAVEAQAETV